MSNLDKITIYINHLVCAAAKTLRSGWPCREFDSTGVIKPAFLKKSAHAGTKKYLCPFLKHKIPESLEDKLVWKSHIALFCLIAMLAGMMGARAISSMAMMLFGLNALWDVHPKRWLEKKWWLLGCAWVALYLLSGFWSADKQEWWEHTQVKMPFLLLPLAFEFLPPFSKKHRLIFSAALAVMMSAGAFYSLGHFLADPAALIHNYKYAQVLPTPFYNDHISFSAAVAVSVVWLLY